MFIVAWESAPPADKAQWIAILRQVLAGELGSYRVLFRKHPQGWRFTLDWREGRPPDEAVVANSPESVAYNIYANLTEAGMPVDRSWRPGTSPERS